MKPPMLVALLVLVVAAAAGRLLWFYASKPEPGEAIPHVMPVACEACGQAYVDTVGRQPAECRFCGQQRAWRAQKCFDEDCGAIFPIVLSGDDSSRTDRPRCTKCGGDRIGMVPRDELIEP